MKDFQDEVIEEDIPTLLDADLLGKSTPAMEELLDRPAVFMAGSLYDQGDRRNTRDGDWKRTESTWYEWMALEKIGLCNHPVAKGKQGKSLVFAEALGGARKDSAIKTMHAIGLDIDSGAALDDVIEKLIEAELFAIVYTSFSHRKSILELKHDDIVRKLKLDNTPNRAQVQAYLREHHKDRYGPEFIDSIKITDSRKQTKDGMRVVVETPALDKFRVILPLAEPVELSDLGTTLTQWKETWEDAVCGVAVNMLDVNFDASSCDVNRLFYTPRHPADAEDWYCAVVQGDPLSFDEIEPYSKNAYVKQRGADSDPFTAGTESSGDQREIYMTPSGRNLNRWHSKHKERFLVTDVIEQFCDDKIVKQGNERVGTVHIECPFEGEHSTTGGTATMCVNPLETEHGFWTVFCRHDACAGRNKLAFLAEMIEQEWFDEELLVDDDFNLGAEDSEYDDGPGEDDPLIVATTFGDLNQAEIQARLNEWAKNGADMTMQNAVTEVIVANTKLGKREVNALWKKARKEKRRKKRGNIPVVNLGAGFRNACDEAHSIIIEQGDDPQLFHNSGRLVDIQEDENGSIRIAEVQNQRFKAHLERVADFDKDDTEVEAPQGLVNNVLQRPRTSFSPLRRLTGVPVFTADKELIQEPGYHSASGIYYHPKTDIPALPDNLTDDYVRECRDELVDLFADFPLDGMMRNEFETAVANGDDVPSLCHTLSIPLTAIAREMINEATPGHLARKDKPRTGATKLTSVAAHIGTLEVPVPQSLPDSKAETQKTVIATIDGGCPVIFFDNLSGEKETESDELASAMTAFPSYQGRRLGSTAMATVLVNQVWMFTGNRTGLSEQLAERMMLIDLDPKMERPGERPRSMFKYDLNTHVSANAARYFYCLLVLVQNWIDKGCLEWTGQPLGGFERHAAVVGGILEAAGLYGFLGNRDKLKSVSQTANPDAELLDALIAKHNKPRKPKETGTLFRVCGDEVPPQKIKNEDSGEMVPFAYRDHRVVSIMETVTIEQIARKGWGYVTHEDGQITYPEKSANTIAQHIAQMVGTVREWGEEEAEKESEQKRYALTKVHKDKHGTLYRFDVLDPVGK